jgi:cyclopropane fatty-acyl-phospholipid synthase-like methyltransferase
MAALNALFDKKKLALTRAKLRAWWDGEAFNEEAALAAYEASLVAAAANENSGDADDQLFDAPQYDMPPRLSALALLWGEGRVRPGDSTADKLEPARIGLAPEGVLAVLGPGLVGPLAAVAAAHPGKIEAYEWREETIDALKHGVVAAKLDDRVTVTKIDLEAHVFTPASFDGLLSTDDFAYCGYPPHLAQQVMKSLKPGACAVVECYVGFKAEDLATAFASSFAEPQIRARADLLQFFHDTGLALEADEDLTDEFLDTARQAFKSLGAKLTEAGAVDAGAARELAWESEAWRMRLMMLAQRRLERRRFTLRKAVEGAAESAPADTQAENAKAPAS